MIKKNSTFPLSAAVATRMTEEIRISFVFLFFAAALLAACGETLRNSATTECVGKKGRSSGRSA